MNPEVKEKWLQALRSGKYKQGKQLLRSKDNKFCCLGVLCDVQNVNWAVQKNAYSVKGLFGFLDDTLREAAELEYNHAKFLYQRNDMYNWSFEKIADWIEENL